jgi:hypothetical protein
MTKSYVVNEFRQGTAELVPTPSGAVPKSAPNSGVSTAEVEWDGQSHYLRDRFWR